MPLTYNRLPGTFTLLLFAGIVLGCDLFNNSMVNYFLDNNEIVTATGLKTAYTILDDDTIIIPPGTAVIEVILSNPRNLSVRQELLGVPDGKTITARQIGPEEIEVKIGGALDGDEYTLTLVMQSPDGLRDFPAYSLRIKCVSSAPSGISSNANLSGISIGGTPVTGFSSSTYSYAENISTSVAPSDKDLTVTAGTPGQTITASLNAATPVALTSGSNHTLTGMKAANSLVITVTAPDGVTQQTYAVSYTWHYGTEWYVSASGNNSNTGTDAGQALASVNNAVAKIKTAYFNAGSNWPGYSEGTPVAARINISGEITEAVTINDSGLPPILLTGSDQTTDKIKATASNRALTIGTAKVILGDGLTLTGGSGNTGGGVFVDSNGSFTMNGGSISGNTATGNGGGVYVTGNNSTFTMNGGTISENEATNDGGGVYTIASAPFTMSGGSISGNQAGKDGGGVGISGSNGQSTFTMNGGSVSGNTAVTGGGGVVASSNGKFIMAGGSLNGNKAVHGGGVCLYVGTFEMNGGSISGNTSTGGGAIDSGGGVLLIGNNNNFTMTGGTISGNVATNGGGVGITDPNSFTLTNTFIMSGGTISGNTANQSGGGVWNKGTFNMKDGALINTDNDVWLENGKKITITGDLTGTPPVARITPQSYNITTQVLDGAFVGANYDKFTVTPDGGNGWTINPTGTLNNQ